MSYKAISIIICLLLGLTTSFNLQSDNNNPITVTPPLNTQNGVVFTIRFSFPAATANAIGPSAYGSSGLNFGQFLGVAFPPSVGTSDLMFDQGSVAKFGCSLTDGTNTYAVTPVQPVASPIISTLTAENNVAYCKLTDKTSNVPLKVGPSITYTLKITLTSVKIASTNFLRTISLFTATSNNPEKMIIDYIPVLGNAVLYTDYTTWTPKALDIVNAAVTVTQGPSASTSGTIVYPYNQFDVTLTLKANNFITAADHVIVFQYPTTTVTAAGTVLTAQAAANDPLQVALKGNLAIAPFGSNGVFLSGVGEDLIPGRQFQISLKGWKALDSNIGVTGAITVLVYYKNTYSVLSSISNNIFLVTQDVLKVTANHPEFWDVYRGGAWPITFTLKTTNDLTSGGWVVIQQTNTLDSSTSGGNKVTFIPSTCDFSKNDSSFDNSFGKRPSCYPLRTMDTAYGAANPTTTAYNGSGFFFFLKGTITGGKVYTVSIWAFFDLCGATPSATLPSIIKSAEASAIPSFTATIYKYINPAVLNETRFSTMASGITQSAISASTQTAFLGNCFNTRLNVKDLVYGNTNIHADIGAVTITNGATGSTLIGMLTYREAFDWYAFAEATDNHAGLGSVYLKDISASLTNAVTGTKFLYSASNSLGSAFFQAAFQTAGNSDANNFALHKLPIPFVLNATPAKAHPVGKWVWQFPALWFTTGNGYTGTSPQPTCYAGWAISSTTKTAGGAATGISPFATFNSGKLPYTAAATGTPIQAFGAYTDDSGLATTIDTTNTVLPPLATGLTGTQTIIKLVSTYWNANTRWAIGDYTKFIDATDKADAYKMGVFTSCVKWVSSLPVITSLYTYIDIQIKWHYISSDSSNPQGSSTTSIGIPMSNLRLIKLFPESGVINDFSKNYSTTQLTNPLVSHTIYVNGGQDTDIDSICLLELNGAALQTQKDASSNTLVLWIFFGTLLESDYNDVTSTYPIAPVNSSISVYGQQVGQPFDIASNGLFTVGNDNISIIKQLMINNSEVNGAASATSSAYYWFLGSTLYFTSATSSSLTVSSGSERTFYVPYYCPRFIKDVNAVDMRTNDPPKGGLIMPVVLGSWITSSAYNNISSVNTNVSYYDTTNTSYNKIFVNKTSTTNMSFKKTKASVTAKAVVYLATLKWGPYTGTDNNLYVYNGKISGANANAVTCSGHVLLLSSGVTIDTSVTLAYQAGYTGSIENYVSTKFFYALGKAWNKAVFYGLNQMANTTPIPVAGNMAVLIATGASTSGNYYTGIKKPTADFFVSGTDLILTDKVAFACASAGAIDNNGLSNYLNPSTSNVVIKNFILDWYSATTVNWLNPSIAWDKTDVYKSDVAANFKTVLSPPVYVPANTNIAFTANSNAIGGNTICGLITTSGGIVTDCTVSSGTATCTLPLGGTSFTVCCYNVVVSDPISFSAVTATFPADSGSVSGLTGISTYLTSSMYSAAAQIGGTTNPYSFVTSNASATDVIGTKNASITAINYSQVNQESGIGKVTFTITLPREPTRDMKLTVQGDLSGMYVSGNVPRCYASFTNSGAFGSSWDNGDALIDTCSANGIQNGTTPIVITTKRMVYKCGVSFSKTLYISLWPVIIVNWANASVNKSFKVTMTLNSGDSIALNTSTFNMALATATSAKPAATAQWDNLCTVSSVTPRIPGEVADYQFDIDLDTNKASLTNANPNEVTIFFPYQYYGSYIPNVMCYNGGMLNCSFSDEGILNIRFSSNLPIGSGKKISIIVAGIPNPAIDSDYSFPCTVNNTNFSTGARTNLVTGSGKLAGGINTTSVTTFGNLRFLQVSTPVSDKNPRNTSTHKFRITFDNVATSTQSQIVVASTPVLYVYFPSDYKLAWYNSKPGASIDEYTNDANNVITKTSTIVPANVVQSGNRIAITLTQTSYTFGTNWRYWDISITNIINPPDTTIQTGPPSTQTTRPYYITLTNSNLSSLYRTYSNVYSYVADPLTASPDSNFPNLAWNRGNSFSFDNSKWVVDIYSTPSQLNTLTIKAGRFLQSYFNIKPNTSNAINPWVTTMTLNDTNFKTSMTTYTLSTSYNQPLGFYIGCACGTAPGYYLVNFASSDSTNFASLSPVIITVDTSTKGTISYQTPANIPAAGSTWVGIMLSEPNFDQLAVNWVPGDNNTNDPTSKITSVTIPMATVTPTTTTSMSPIFSVFSITNNSQTLGSQTFKTSDPNNCYTWNGIVTVSFNISGQTAVIPSSLQLAPSFKYSNASTDATITVKNSIKFNFTPPAAPIYIYCALICFNQSYPADATIMTVPQTVANTPYTQYYANILNTNTPVDIIFSGLVRGMQYKMRCIIYSTDGDSTKRTTSSVNIESYTQTGVSNSTTVQIMPTASQATQCVQWQFLSEPGTNTRVAVVNYCQKLFSTPGWWNNGCVICTYSDMTNNTPGLVLPTNITCSATGNKKRLRMLQNASVANPNVTANTPATLTVCPVAHPVCNTDVAGNKVYTDYFNQLINDLKSNALFLTTLNINNVFLNVTVPTVTISDSVTPDLTKLVSAVASSNANGAVSWTAQYSSPLACFWQIAASTVTPASYSAIQSCTDINWCGAAKVGAAGTTISTVNLNAFAAGTTYNIWMSCTNDIPFAQRQSNVKNAASFTIPAPTPPPASTNSTVTPTTISSGFVSFSLMAVFMLFALLF